MVPVACPLPAPHQPALAPTGSEHHLSLSRPRCHPSAACQVVPGAQKCCDRNIPTATCRLKMYFSHCQAVRAKQFTNGQPQESCGWQCLSGLSNSADQGSRDCAVPGQGWRSVQLGFSAGGDQGCGLLGTACLVTPCWGPWLWDQLGVPVSTPERRCRGGRNRKTPSFKCIWY